MSAVKPAKLFHYFCPCPRGLEAVLARELTALDGNDVQVSNGGVACRGPLSLGYRINLEARIPSRVLLRLIDVPCTNERVLYQRCREVVWEDWFSARHTLRVDVVAIRSPLKSLNFATLRIKDAIVDRFRERGGLRPSIDTRNPDVRISAFLTADRLQLYVDLSGEPLFKRGWRSGRDRRVFAPLKENLAAGLLALSGWQPGRPLGDMFCGSGTIIIEAAQQLCGRAPGLNRKFGIERLSIHEPTLLHQLIERLENRARDGMAEAPHNQLWASDLDAHAIELARTNLELAGLPADLVRFRQADAAEVRPPEGEAGITVSNPPYNERVGIPLEHWRDIGRNLREHFGGWHVFLLTSDRALPGQLGLREKHKTPLFNGALECRLFDFEMRKRG
ncbi:MAG: THUMP domain-containing protein [Lautropia sp.]|nr:THUMP domain-containing protein [Lautropia sp.]